MMATGDSTRRSTWRRSAPPAPNPGIKAFHDRLRAAGKPPKVARCAAARKLLHLAWALGTKQQRFDPEHEQQQHEAVPDLAA